MAKQKPLSFKWLIAAGFIGNIFLIIGFSNLMSIKSLSPYHIVTIGTSIIIGFGIIGSVLYNIHQLIHRSGGTQLQLEEQVEIAQQLYNKLEDSNAIKSEVVSNLSHELRTPLNGILGMNEILLSHDLNEEQTEIATTVQNCGKALVHLIDDLLDLSSLQQGSLVTQEIPFDLQSLISETIEAHSQPALEKNLVLNYTIDEKVPIYLKGDPARIRQVFGYLISNAIKFTPSGTITIEVLAILHEKNRALLRLAVRDTGIGILKSQLGKLFEPFTQGDGSHIRKYGGTGIGLTLAKQIVDILEGEIGCDSIIDKGSYFWFDTLFKIQKEKPVQQLTGGTLKDVPILIVDDNELNIRILRKQLEHHEMVITAASDGAEALHMIYSHYEAGAPFKLVISDMIMPGMGGMELGQALRTKEQFNDLQLLLLTSHALKGDAQLAEESGFNAYLTKPAKEHILTDILTRMMSSTPSTHLITQHSIREEKHIFHNCSAKVLVVEDELTNQIITQSLLNTMGIVNVIIAENGKVALDVLKGEPIDFVFMDIQMPEMDGVTATKIIRSPSSPALNPQVPIYALTTHSEKEEIKKYLKAGMNGHLMKPINLAKFGEAMVKWLPDQ
ncbi:MAG: response regulator [Fibrobacterales bacterium]